MPIPKAPLPMLSQRSLVPGLVVMLVVLAACDLTTPNTTPTPVLPALAPATPSPSGTMPAAAPLTSGPIDAAFISQAISATQALSRYHYHYQATGLGADYDTDLEGDYLGVSEGYTKGRVGGQQVEHIFTQRKIFRKAGDRWVLQAALELPAAESFLTLDTDNFAASLAVPNIQLLGQARTYLSAGQDFQDSGVDDTIGSIRARRITFTVDATKFSPGAPTPTPAAPVSSGTIWIEQASHRIVQLILTLPPGALLPNGVSDPTPPVPPRPIIYQFTFSRLDDPALVLPPLDLSQALIPLPATPNAGLPPLVAQALDTLDHLHNVHYDQTMSNGSPGAGDYVPTQPGQWRQLHASMDPVEYTLLYLALAQDFQAAGPVPIGTVPTEEFHFPISLFGSDVSGKLVVPPDARSGRIPFIGEGTVAIDPTTHYIMRLVVHLYKNDVTSSPENTITLLLTQHDAASSAGPTPTPDLVPRVMAAMDALSPYHVQSVATTDGFTDTVTNDIDVVAPDNFYAHTNQSAYGGNETLMSNGQFYVKSDGTWLKQDGTLTIVFPGGVSIDGAGLWTELDNITFFRRELIAAWDFREVSAAAPGNGVPTQAFTFELAPYSLRAGGIIEPFPDGQTRPPIGNGTIYLDPATRLIQKLVMNQAVYTLTDHYYDAANNMQSPPATMQLHITITYSRPNDPSLTLPSP